MFEIEHGCSIQEMLDELSEKYGVEDGEDD